MSIISIIVPVYNVEAYLPRCIESLLSQTFNNIEIILINDGSTDSSAIICDQYQQLDKRIRVTHQSNQGVSYARNVGIEQAVGEYLSFVDSDDWVSPNYIELLLKAITQQQDIDVAFCEYYTVRDGKPVIHCCNSEDNIYDHITGVHMLCQDKEINNYVWGKLYKKELFASIRFPEERAMCEDMAILYKVFYLARKIYHIQAPAYYYLVRTDSSINSRWTPLKAYHYFLGGYEQTMFMRENNILADKRKKHECIMLRRGIHLIHHLMKLKDYSDYESMIQDIIEKTRSYSNLGLLDIGIHYYLENKLVHSSFHIYSHIYRTIRGL